MPHFQETATPEEWARALREWSESHGRDTPLLSDEAISRESIYAQSFPEGTRFVAAGDSKPPGCS